MRLAAAASLKTNRALMVTVVVLLVAVELTDGALAGGGLVLGGAAALGELGWRRAVIRDQGAAASTEPASFSQRHHLWINDVCREAAPGVVHIAATTKVPLPGDPFC